MHRICRVGMIVLLLLTCSPHIGFLGEKVDTGLACNGDEGYVTTVCSESNVSPAANPLSELNVGSSSPPITEEATTTAESLSPTREKSDEGFTLERLPFRRATSPLEFDIPIVINERVEQFIQYFQTTGRKAFTRWLARSEKYIPFMRNLLREKGLPEDLVYMALIESGFNPNAYSRRKASGPWQFIYLTGKKYGLKVNWWVDERRDPEKSTIAAAKYLKDLYDLFECWYLAAAGYNAGEGKIINAIRRYRTEDFWELTRYRYLKRETKDYVPQMIAAALIAKDPEKYGFVNIEYEEPLRYEKVTVPPVTDLRLIAKACETSVQELKDLNPELLRWCTPPGSSHYEIRIPFGKRELFEKNFESLPRRDHLQFKTHTVRRGETLGAIARFYRVDLEPILELNQLKRSSLLSVGMNLLIPVPKDTKVGLKTDPKAERRGQVFGGEEIVYTIKKGDTLWSIANEMGVNIGALSRWNNIHPDQKLMPGDKLRIRIYPSHIVAREAENNELKEITYVVREGDSLWSIAQKFRVTVEEIRAWNSLDAKDQIRPQDRLKLKVRPVRF